MGHVCFEVAARRCVRPQERSCLVAGKGGCLATRNFGRQTQFEIVAPDSNGFVVRCGRIRYAHVGSLVVFCPRECVAQSDG